MAAGAPDPERLLAQLSPRQRQVLTRWARGERPAAIAAALGLAASTVRVHLRDARARLLVALPKPPRPARPVTCSGCRTRPPRPGLRTCARCIEQSVRSQQAKRASRAAAGLCTVCGEQPRREGLTDCAACARARNAKRRTTREQWIAAGLCQECGKRPPELIGGMACLCRTCAARHIRSDLRRGRRRDNPLEEEPR